MKRMIVILMMLVMLLCMMTVSVFAGVDTSNFSQKFSSAEQEYVESNIKNMKTYLTQDSSKTDDTENYIVVEGGSDASGRYYVVSGKTPSDVKSYLSSRAATQKTNEITNGLNFEADTNSATNAISGFRPAVNFLLGLIVTIITAGMALFTSFDVCYIVFPVFREKCDSAKMEGQSSTLIKKSANGETKLRFVSDEAQFAVQHATLEQGANPLMSYFKNRLMTYIVVAIILFILLTGNISLITDIALKLVSGIVQLLSSWA